MYGLVFVMWSIFHWGGEENVTLISDLAALPIDFLAAVVAWQVFRNAKLDQRVRKAWLIFGLAMFSYFVGDVIWSYLENALHVQPFPAISDAFYLGLYPLVLWGLSILPTAPLSRRERLTFWLDLLTTLIVATMALTYFIVIPTAQANASDPFTQIVLVAYPLGDLVIFGGLVAILLRRSDHDTRSALSFFLIGMVLFLSADLGFDYMGLAGTFVSGGLIDACWVGAHVLYILAALRQLYRSPVAVENKRLTSILDGITQVLPYVAVGGSYILAADAILTDFGPTAIWLLAGAVLSTILFIARQLRQVRIQVRLTAFILVTTIPLLVGVTALISSRATTVITEQANTDLQKNDEFLATNVATWLELHARTLQEMASLPDIVSMDPAQQKPTLLAISSTHPNLFLVQTTDSNGLNIARNDDSKPKDYHDRTWFLGAKSGAPITYEVLISRTTGKPALSLAAPIRNAAGQIIGVASVASELNEISTEVLSNSNQERGSYTYIVDANNRIVAHPDPTMTSGDHLADLSTYPPIAALRQGQTGLISFTDENGEHWRAYITSLENGWGIVAQQPVAELLAPVHGFQRIAIGLIAIVATIILLLTWFTIQNALQPIGALTAAAAAVAAGKFNHVVATKSEDELGMLASTFNSMTVQLRDLIGSLERRVADRTKALTISSEVSRRLSTILDQKQLVSEVVNQVRDAFGYYHVQIYFYDEARENLIMAGGTGEAGRTMLEKSHKLVKERGLVGRAAENNEPILVADTTQNPQWLPNPLLPDTKSEAAIPISVGDLVLGVLDVQHNIPDGLKHEDIDALQSIAYQVAVAYQNTKSYTEIQRSQTQLSEALNISRLGNWEYDFEKDVFTFNDQFYSVFHTTAEKVGGYKLSSADYARNFVHPEDAVLVGSEIQKAIESKERHYSAALEHRSIFENGEIGYMSVIVNVEHDENGKITRWYGANQDVTERRRLEELNRKRAVQQEAINQITQKIQSASTIEDAMQVAARELGHALGMKPTAVTLDVSALARESNKGL